MSDIYEIINSLGFKEEDANKLKIYLITNHEIRKELNSALVSCETEKSKQDLLKSFFYNITGMLDKIFAFICYEPMTNLSFVPYHVLVDLDEHQGKP
jgi:hypothetical protein